MAKLDGKIALVTAGSRGIGLAIVNELAEQGAHVYIGVRRIEVGEEIAKELKEKGLKASAVYFDACKEETYAEMVNTVAEKEGRLDILVNNVASGDPARDLDVVNGDTEVWNRLIRANLNSVYLTSKAAVPVMIKNGGGNIVNIASIAAMIPDVVRTGYNVAKTAIVSLTKNIAVQYGRKGIRCNAVLPGMIETDSVKNSLPDEFRDLFIKHLLVPRIGKVEDISKATLYLASDDSSYVTGQALEVAGGMAVATPLYGDMMMGK